MTSSSEENFGIQQDGPSILTRRKFMWVAGAGIVFAACGGGSDGEGDEGSTDEDSSDTSAADSDSGGDDSGDSGGGGGDDGGGGDTVLRVAFPESPNEFDPAKMSAFPEYNTNYAIYDGLVRVDANLVPQPALAESWETSPDGLTWTFNLRSGVKFHHGKDFVADDVVHTFNRILDPSVESPLATPLAIIESVEAVDDKTAQFNLSSANGDLTVIFGSPQARIVPSDRSQDEYRSDPSGTGPFKFVDHIAGERTTFEANADYWGDGPFVAGMEFLAMPEASTQVQALSAGQIDIMWQVGAENISTLEGADDVQVLNVASGAYQTIAMQADVAPFDNPKVREAVRKCVDRNAMLQAVLQGVGEVGNDHPVPSFNPFAAGIPLKEADIEGAKALLAEAGFPDGIEVELTTSTVRAGMVEAAETLQAMCAPAGINITIDSAPPDNYWSEVWLNRPFFTSNWGMRPSIDETFSLVYASDAKWNEGNWGTPELDAAIAAGRASTDEAERAAQYETAQQILHDEGGAVVIAYFKPTLQAQRGNVSGYVAHPAQWMYLDTVKVA